MYTGRYHFSQQFLKKKKKKKKKKKSQGAPGFEPGTSRSAVECSTTELYPQLNILARYLTLYIEINDSVAFYPLYFSYHNFQYFLCCKFFELHGIGIGISKKKKKRKKNQQQNMIIN